MDYNSPLCCQPPMSYIHMLLTENLFPERIMYCQWCFELSRTFNYCYLFHNNNVNDIIWITQSKLSSLLSIYFSSGLFTCRDLLPNGNIKVFMHCAQNRTHAYSLCWSRYGGSPISQTLYLWTHYSIKCIHSRSFVDMCPAPKIWVSLFVSAQLRLNESIFGLPVQLSHCKQVDFFKSLSYRDIFIFCAFRRCFGCLKLPLHVLLKCCLVFLGARRLGCALGGKCMLVKLC